LKRLAILLLWLWPFTLAAQTAQEEADTGFLASLISDNLSGVSRDVRIIGFEGALSSRSTVRVLTVADAEGVWLRMEGLTLDWTRSALFSGALSVNELSARQITLLRAPVSEGSAPPSPEASPFALPNLPISVEIGALRVDRITLGAPLLGEEITLSLDGRAALSGGEGTAVVTADRLDGAEGHFELSGAYSNTTRILALTADLTEAPEGIIARLLDLPGKPAVRLTLDGTAPIDDYTANLAIATDGQDRITGTFGQLTRPDADGGPPARDFRLNVQGDVTPLIAPAYSDFFGPDVRLSLAGTRAGDGALSLSQLFVLSQALRLSGSLELTPDGWPLRLDLAGEISADDGSPVLLPVAGAATYVEAMTLDVTYDLADGDRWEGAFDLTGFARPGMFIPALTLAGDGVIQPARPEVAGLFSADLAYGARGLRLEDPALAEAIGPSIAGVIRLARRDDGPFEIAQLTLDGPGVAMSAEGTIAGPGEGFRTRTSVALTADRLDRFARLTGLDLGGAAALTILSDIRPLDGLYDLILSGQTRDLALGIDAADRLLAGEGVLSVAAVRDTAGTRVEQLDVTTPALRATGAADITSGQSEARFDLTITDAALVLPDLAGPATLSGTATRDAAGLVVADVRAALGNALAEITAQMDAAGVISTQALASVDSLEPFSALAGRDIAGSLEAIVTGTAQRDGTTLDITVIGQSRDLTIDQPQADALLAGEGRIAARLIRSGAVSLRLEDVTVTTPALTGSGRGSVDGVGAEAAFDLRLADMALLLPDLAGPATLTGTATRDAVGAVTLDVAAQAPGGQAQLQAVVTDAGDGPVAEGQVEAAIADLAPFSPLAGRALRGALSATLTGKTRADLALFDLRLDGQSRDLGTGIAQLDPLLRGAGRFGLRMQRTGAQNLQIDDLEVATPALLANGDARLTGAAGDARIHVELPQAGVLLPGLSGPAALAGTARRDDTGVITLAAEATGPGTSAQVDATIAAPADGMLVNTVITAEVRNLAPFSALAGRRLSGAVQGRVAGQFLPDASRLDLRLDSTLTNLDPGIAAVATVLRGTGTLGARVARGPGGGLRVEDFAARFPNLTVTGSLDGAGSTGQARFDARLADIGLFTPDFSGPVTAVGTAALDAASNWRVQTEATGPGGTGATIGGQIGADGRLALSITGTAPLGLVNGSIEPRRLDGLASFDLTVNGPAALSSLGGTVRIAGARLSAPVLGQALTDLGGTITLGGSRATLALAAAAEAGGRVAIDGSVGLDAPFAADLRVRLDRLGLRDPQLYATTATGTISVTGPITGGARIAGVIDLGPTEVQVPSSGVSALGNLPDVVHLDAPTDVRRTLERAGLGLNGRAAGADGSGAGGPGIALDITIRAPARVFIRGRGLDAELGGELRLTGTTRQVIPVGRFELLRGRLSILQQRFDLTEGYASVQGDFAPFLRLVATTTARTGTLVSIIVEGVATEPEVRFVSSPELPQDEVLAQLIFGRDISSISPLQAVQLAAAIGTLAGRGGGGLIDGLRQGIGLDDLDFAADAEGNAAVRAGKYLSENVYTDVTIGSASTEINLNLDLTDSLTVRGSVDTTGDTSLGIFFERDY